MPNHASDHETAGDERGQTLHKLALELGLTRPGPRDLKRDDQRIREDVCERLAWEPAVDVSEVTVAVTDGTVFLEGTVPQRQMKHRIEDLCAACSGVKDVDNRIRVARMEASPPGAGIV